MCLGKVCLLIAVAPLALQGLKLDDAPSLPASPLPAWVQPEGPTSSEEFSSLMAAVGGQNEPLLRYVYPTMANLTNDVYRNWVPFTSGCEVREDCYCYHVNGDMSKSRNPDGWKSCASGSEVKSCNPTGGKDCACLSGTPCLFSDMRPAKIYAVIAGARAAGVTHIIEEGRYGGLSAFMYSSHGFRVTSVEFLPLDGATEALTAMSPSVKLANGDGSVLLPQLLSNISRAEAAKTLVIFDGEKRFAAWKTFEKIRHNVAFAVFDDTNLVDGYLFIKMLKKTGEVWWDTRREEWKKYIKQEPAALTLSKPLQKTKKPWHGGMNSLGGFHFSFVKGGAWGAK